ncbi:MAG: peptide ligase PGM1-related protein [Syntrophomonadaceae bacterium]
MIPKPPFARDLTPEVEIAEFERLKPRLATLWNALSAREEEPYTSVVIPSLTLDQSELAKLEAASFYEERLLFLLIRLRNPQARMVYVTSQPVHPLILEYYFQLLAGIPASHARARLTLLCAYDASPRSLTEKILERPRLIQRIRYGIADSSRAFMTVFNSTPLERKLAVLLGIPLNGVDPALCHLGTKSGSRRVFREAGVALPDGAEGLHSEDDVVAALDALRERRPDIRRAVLKLDDSFSGEGNAIFQYPKTSWRGAIRESMANLTFSLPTERDRYRRKFSEMGGIVEELLEYPEGASPSVQLRIDPHGEVVLLSTHDQILGGPSSQVYEGCRFPAREAYRRKIQDAALRIGAVLASKGVVSRFGVDFFVGSRGEPGDEPEIFALEINLRMGGTTHPFLALQFLTGGKLDETTGLFLSPAGKPKFYRSTDNLRSEAYRGLCPEDLIDIMTMNRLHYSHGRETGALFHMIGALSQYGKVGLTAIGNSRDEADSLFAGTLEALDREAAR